MIILRHINKTVRYGNKILDYSVPSSPIPTGTLNSWFMADAGVTKNGSNRISQWDDQSGNGNHLVQATGANQPLYDSSQQLNGYDAVYLDGDIGFAEYMTGSTSIDYNSTIFLVGTIEYDGGPHDDYSLISSNNGNSGTRLMGFQSVSVSDARYYAKDISQSSGGHQVQGPDTVPVGGTPFRFIGIIDPPTNSSLWLDGVEDTSLSESGSNYVVSVPDWIFGKNPTSSIGYHGRIWELIIYDGTLSSGDITSVESYIQNKYNL